MAFKDQDSFKKWSGIIKLEVELCEWLNVKDMHA